MMNEKKQYTAPELKVHGNVEEITLAHNGNNVIDGTYVAGTPLTGHTS